MRDEQSNQKLWQENKGEHCKRYANDHRNRHDNAKYFIAQFVIQPAFKTVHFLLRLILFFLFGHLFLCGFHQAAVAIPHRNHKVKAAPYKRALPIPRHFFPVVFFPRFYINRSIRQPACHCFTDVAEVICRTDNFCNVCKANACCFSGVLPAPALLFVSFAILSPVKIKVCHSVKSLRVLQRFSVSSSCCNCIS